MSFYPLRRLIIPFVLLIAAIVIRGTVAGLEDIYLHLLDWLPYLTLGIVLIMCAYYGTARVFTAALTLAVAYFLIQSQLQVALTDADPLFVYTGISIVLPLIFLLLFILPERGLWNHYGASVVAVIPVLLIAGALLLQFLPDAGLLKFLNTSFAIKPFAGYILSINSTIVFLVALVPGLLRLYRYDGELDAALLGSLLFAYFTLVLFDRNEISTLMFGFAGVCLIISMTRSIYDMAYRDELTGLPGRRALNERLKGLRKRYAIAMMDVDHFKKFNDVYGHDIGDEVLKMVARHIGGITGGGTGYRYGGEEFCVVFPGRDIEYCKPFLEAVRVSIENYSMRVRDLKNRPKSKKVARQRRGRRSRRRGGKTVSVTISIGLAGPNPRRSTAEDVLKAADDALYKAKGKGRNCMVASK
jgi:diguanylate cyclase (GGDEF)-like protein